MKLVEGRKDSFVLLPNGQVMSPIGLDAAMCMFRFHNDIEQYRIIQKRIDVFEILIKMSSKQVQTAIVEKELINHLSKTLNVSLESVVFQVRFVGEIPVEKTGKLRKVVSEVTHGLY